METDNSPPSLEPSRSQTDRESPTQKRAQSLHSSQEDVTDKRSSKKRRENTWKRHSKQAVQNRSQKKPNQRSNTRKEAANPWGEDDTKNRADDAPKPIYAIEFSKEEIAEEERRPKKKVAVMIGYCGTGYKGLQIMSNVKTIESDIFGALVAANFVSKANANEPKKVQLVRCARTDKGVHAGGNVLSLKMIIQDGDMVQKINNHLPPQIRVWGIEQTIGSFNAYQQCDSRIYEYLIPTHCFLPPHPQTFLGKKLEELAEEAGDIEGYRARQEDVANFWAETEERYVKPVLDAMDPEIRAQAMKNLFVDGENSLGGSPIDLPKFDSPNRINANPTQSETPTEKDDKSEKDISKNTAKTTTDSEETPPVKDEPSPLDQAIRSIKKAHHQARLAYRISPTRLSRIKSILALYVGTWRYHNYTIQKPITDPSCKRHIKSFLVHNEPFLIGTTEWISLKVHGQSFMMNQIRKMVLMAAMLVRCGTHENRIQDSFSVPRMSIPRAPALGLLLERPIFEAYNKFGRFKGGNARDPIAFDKYQAEMDAFKQKEIYDRMWREEAENLTFENFFAGLDSLDSSQMLWTTSMGLAAVQQEKDGKNANLDVDKALGEEETVEPGEEEG